MGDREWTDQELDDALAALHSEAGTGGRATVRARAMLLAAIDEPAVVAPLRVEAVPIPRRARRFGGSTRWMAAAAVVAVLVGGGLVAQARSAAPGASAQVVDLLTRSADVISVQDDMPLGPGQYRVVRTHAWKTMRFIALDRTEHRYLFEETDTEWTPFDPADEWQLTVDNTGNRRWITDEQAGRAAGADETRGRIGAREPTSGPFTEVFRAPRGEYFGPPSGAPDPTTADAIAALPRDPGALFALIGDRVEAPGPENRRRDAALLAFPADLLRTGRVPADLRAAFYEMLTRVPSLRVTDERADLDGRIGVALGLTDLRGQTQEIIVDPATGDFLGERLINPDGTLLAYTAVTVGVADELGVEPAG